MDLIERSIKIIEENQSEAGSYVASPNFSQYGYCWFRDGSFTAHAMQKAGKKESAEKFIRWGLNVLKRYRHSLEEAAFGPRSDLSILLPTRYTLDGFVSEDDWTNAQSDGYGTFLWIVAENPQLLDESDLEICDLCAKYLEGVWEIPCYDVWEEFPTMIHTSTLISIVAGL
ncbi:MAG: glycoside hydrolase family 15 protein, partial [Mesotoga sp.]|uniref:glycoside hydrolase family 15 protein n=1 Tax=Mesotoga sp. TaxID=2053577 RepID=UPI00261CACFD